MISRTIVKKISMISIFCSIMADKVKNCSNKVQFVIFFRWSDKGSDTHDDFIGVYNVDNIKAVTLVTVIKKRFD